MTQICVENTKRAPDFLAAMQQITKAKFLGWIGGVHQMVEVKVDLVKSQPSIPTDPFDNIQCHNKLVENAISNPSREIDRL